MPTLHCSFVLQHMRDVFEKDQKLVFDTYVHASQGFVRLTKLLKRSTNNSYSSKNKPKI